MRTLSVILLSGVVASAQQNTADVLKTIDQLVEQNRQLEKQNQQLMEQIGALRQALANDANRSPTAPPSPTSAASAQEPAKQTGAVSTSQQGAENDDKNYLPEASDGR